MSTDRTYILSCKCFNSLLLSNSARTSFYTVRLKNSTAGQEEEHISDCRETLNVSSSWFYDQTSAKTKSTSPSASAGLCVQSQLANVNMLTHNAKRTKMVNITPAEHQRGGVKTAGMLSRRCFVFSSVPCCGSASHGCQRDAASSFSAEF